MSFHQNNFMRNRTNVSQRESWRRRLRIYILSEMQGSSVAISFTQLQLHLGRAHQNRLVHVGGCALWRDFYRPQTKFAKVMFSQVSVCPQGGRAWHACPPVTHVPPRHAHTPRYKCPSRYACPLQHPWACMLPSPGYPCPSRHAPPGHTCHPQACLPPWRILWDAFNERVVRILLECILVYYATPSGSR